MKEIQPQQIWNEEKMEGVKKVIQKHKLITMMEQDEQLGLYQETLEENCCTPVGQIKRYVDCKGCDRKPKQETLEEGIKQTTNPTKEDSYICRMDNCYIKMCYWNGVEWLDMWKSTLDGIVKNWIEIPNNI